MNLKYIVLKKVTRLNKFIILLLSIISFSCSSGGDDIATLPPEVIQSPQEDFESFEFISNGVSKKGKIYLPSNYETNKNLPTIYLIDYHEQHFKVATDEFERVISAVNQINGFDALVVTLYDHLNIDTEPNDFQHHYDIFKDMASYVDNNYTSNTSRTFIGRGSEAGLVLITLFLEASESSIFDNFIATDSSTLFNTFIQNLVIGDEFPKGKSSKKLHFSFSSTNNADVCNETINKISEAQYSWLEFESIEYHSDYESTYPTSYAAGIKYVFN